MRCVREELIKFRAGRTQKDMAQKYGVSQQVWNCWEKGVSSPRVHMMKRLSDDSHVSMEKLFPDQFNDKSN